MPEANLTPGEPDAEIDPKDEPGVPPVPEGQDPEYDPTAGVTGTYAAQPDPNADRPGGKDLGPNIPDGAKKAPQADKAGTPAVGKGV